MSAVIARAGVRVALNRRIEPVEMVLCEGRIKTQPEAIPQLTGDCFPKVAMT